MDQTTRVRLVAALRADPGLHLRALAREVGTTPQNAAYHVRWLVAFGFVCEARLGRRRCLFAAGAGRAARAAWASQLAAQGAQRARVLAAVLEAPGIHQAELARLLGVHPGSVRHAVRGLLEAGLLEEASARGRRCFAPTPRAAGLAPR